MRIWMSRTLTLVWAGFWLWFGIAEGIYVGRPWYVVISHGLPIGLAFLIIALIAWRWPKPGAVLLILTGFVIAGLYPIYWAGLPTNTKLFGIATLALPPLLSGLMLLWPSGSWPQHPTRA